MASAIFVSSKGTTRLSRLRTSRMAPISAVLLGKVLPPFVRRSLELGTGLRRQERHENGGELHDVGELPVDRGEADVGYLVQVLQLLDHPLSDGDGVHLPVRLAEEIGLEAVDDSPALGGG